MADLIIVFWRDIPAQIIVKAGRRSARRQLPKRFAEAIDRCAMASQASDSESYLEAWRRGEPVPCGDDLETQADAAVAHLEAHYDTVRLRRLVAAGGQDEVSASHRSPG